MKIALIREKYTDFGGAERYVASLAENLALRGNEVEIFARTWKTSKSVPKSGEACHSPVLHRVPVLKGPSFLEIISFAVNVRKMLKKNRYDIIHSFERTLYQDIYRAGDGCHRQWLAQRSRIESPLKGMVNRVNPLHVTLLWMEKQIFKENGCRAVMANSQRGKKEIVDLYRFPEDKIQVIYSPVDQQRFFCSDRQEKKDFLFRKYRIEPGNPLLLFVGSGFKRKGLTATLKALSLLPSPAHLIVVGKDRISPYARLARELNIDEFVSFTGPISDVAPYYQGADLLVFPTIYEPFSNVCLEAMAAGLPVVTSRINGASEVIVEGQNGYVIENPLDPAEIMLKIRQGLDIAKDCIEATNRNILCRLTWDNHIEQILDLYRTVLISKGRIQ
ncbi:MAG: Lipopolysaccharide core biosynthesis protein RfaG [Syntrophus sp. PtaB.Bin001]|nr:MAG: Lipopolysaccharide core biosynthesis protein RfaG [Syntrophus sp. PtaB.Bin001]